MALVFDELVQRHVWRFTLETIDEYKRGDITQDQLAATFADAMKAAALDLPIFWLIVLKDQRHEDIDELMARVGIVQDTHAQTTIGRVKKRRAAFRAIEGGKDLDA